MIQHESQVPKIVSNMAWVLRNYIPGPLCQFVMQLGIIFQVSHPGVWFSVAKSLNDHKEFITVGLVLNRVLVE